MRWFARQERNAVTSGRRVEWTAFGIDYTESDGSDVIPRAIIEPALVQWADEGYAVERDARWHVPWDAAYQLIAHADNRIDVDVYGIPKPIELAPRLLSRGSLTDPDFVIATAGWVDGNGRVVDGVTLLGPVATVGDRKGLLPNASWELLKRVVAFAQRSDEERDERSQRLAWGEIRRLALAAGARLDDFLYRTVVLSPDRLKIGLRRYEGTGARVIEVVPGFEGCPDAWLAAFDGQTTVRDRYDLSTPEGIVQVVVKPEVCTVLEQIRRMPGRRVTGARAEAFITNPFAALGEAASQVIDADQFEAERERAGLIFDRFTAYVDRNSTGYPVELGLQIESGSGPASQSLRQPLTFDEAQRFVASVRASLEAGNQLCVWKEFEFDLLGNVDLELQTLDQALAQVAAHGSETQRSEVTSNTVYDLSNYSQRIDGIGEEKPYASPYIARKDEGGGWFPDNLVDIVELPPAKPGEDPRYVPLTVPEVKKLEERVRAAQAAGASTIRIPGVEDEIPIADLKEVLDTFARAHADAERGTLEDAIRENSKRKLRKGLLIKPNIATVDYFEQRRNTLLTRPDDLQLPRTLKPGVQLKQHQLEGVAWLQHLFRYSPWDCRGAVLADDMGLGKTLQILTLIAWAHEQDAQLPPALIVAPVALLENWHEEARKFLREDTLLISEIYGDTLAGWRVPKEDIDEQLRRDGLVKFLRPGWVGRAKIVFTTYETLRDLEFSFAAEKWSILVCDEAQKVKNPNALVTRAAKKQNARFRVACTGTPVENTLADLWCLFDFVQPGLLGALNEFGQLYRRPIEAKTEDEKARIEELRELIKPQLLRRLKADVAKDLPKKLEVENCKSLPLSAAQRALYAQAVGQFGRRMEPGAVTPFKNALGLLHYLRLICTDPKPHGLASFRIEPLAAYRTRTPKLHWLLQVLKDIQARDEKALVFCEFKDIQRLLRHYIEEELRYVPDIINGDTAAASKSEQSRQKRIRAFQESPGFGVLILSPLAVGFGVNIQAANHVIHYTRTWNPAKEDQATDRAYRIGQDKDVYVYCPVVAAADFKTFDVKLDELLRHKRSLAQDMLNGSGDLSATEFDLGEVAPPGTSGIKPRALTFDDVLRMQSRYFEAYIAALWSRQGYPKVTLTPASGDGGVDVVALQRKEGELIQCKTSQSTGRELGWEAIKDVVTGEAAYRAQYRGIQFLKVCVTTQSFNSGAHRQAQLNQVRLIDQVALEALHSQYPMTLEDVERVLYADAVMAR